MRTKRFGLLLIGGLVGAALGLATTGRGGTDAIGTLNDSRASSAITNRCPFWLDTTIHEKAGTHPRYKPAWLHANP